MENDREKWISDARASFNPSEKESCCVCFKYKSIVHAHHLIPLSVQYKNGFVMPNQEFLWLCPNHHYIFHLAFSRMFDKDFSKSKINLDSFTDLNEHEVNMIFSVYEKTLSVLNQISGL